MSRDRFQILYFEHIQVQQKCRFANLIKIALTRHATKHEQKEIDEHILRERLFETKILQSYVVNRINFDRQCFQSSIFHLRIILSLRLFQCLEIFIARNDDVCLRRALQSNKKELKNGLKGVSMMKYDEMRFEHTVYLYFRTKFSLVNQAKKTKFIEIL